MTTQTTEEMRNKIVDILMKWNMPTRQVAINELVDLFADRELRVKEEVLDMISKGQGWEETRDFYANMLGLPTKYKK